MDAVGFWHGLEWAAFIVTLYGSLALWLLSIFVSGFVTILVVVGVLFAPVAGRKYAIASDDRSLRRTGAIASMSALIPWFYCMRQARGQPVVGRFLYNRWTAYAAWLLGPIGYPTSLSALTIFGAATGHVDVASAAVEVFPITLCALSLCGVIMQRVRLPGFISAGSQTEPFTWLSLWTVAMLVYHAVVFSMQW